MYTNIVRNRLIFAGRTLLLGLTFFFGQVQAQATSPYDGIYQWSPGQYLSLHQDGTKIIAALFFTNDGNYTFPAAAGAGTLPVQQLDIFDLMSGPVTGSTAQMDGTRFHRACNVAYDFRFNNDATITVTRIGVSNTAAAGSAHISCSSIVGMEAATMIVPKIRFNPTPTPTPVVVAATCSASNFTSSIYNAIQIGMTVDQVNQTVGCQNNPALTSRMTAYIMFTWISVNSSAFVQVYFDDTGTYVTPLFGNSSSPYKASMGF